MSKHAYTVLYHLRGAWRAQLVGLLTLDFGSGHDLRVMGSSPTWALRSVQSLLENLFLPLPLPLPASHSLKKKKCDYLTGTQEIEGSFTSNIFYYSKYKSMLPYSFERKNVKEGLDQ